METAIGLILIGFIVYTGIRFFLYVRTGQAELDNRLDSISKK